MNNFSIVQENGQKKAETARDALRCTASALC